jgi:hypothetical protein
MENWDSWLVREPGEFTHFDPPETQEEEHTCIECKHCKLYAFYYTGHYMCMVREGNESGKGESNVNTDDEACGDFDLDEE